MSASPNPPSEEPRRTPLWERHRAHDAKLVDFAGWEMPARYTSIVDEHRAVRSAAGLFDVSHMGEIRVTGEGAVDFLQWLTPNDVASLDVGQAHYTGLLNEAGGYLDDLLLYRLGGDEFLLVVNAANRERDVEWISEHAREGVEVADVSDDYALLALQGPRAADVLEPLTPLDLGGLRSYRFAAAPVSDCDALVSRTGYTGEDGFEIYLSPVDAVAVWGALLETGAGAGLVPAGLGARDTLRIEAGMALYGHEIDEETTPLEARSGWIVDFEKGEFIGRQALVRQRDEGVARRLVGFEVIAAGIVRQGAVIRRNGTEVGVVTSGTWSPTFERALGMARLESGHAEPDTELTAIVRDREIPMRVAELPFYRRS